MSLAFEQIKTFSAKAKSTDVFVLNLSDLLPVMFSVETILRYLWDPSQVDRAASPRVAQTQALQSWVRAHAGAMRTQMHARWRVWLLRREGCPWCARVPGHVVAVSWLVGQWVGVSWVCWLGVLRTACCHVLLPRAGLCVHVPAHGG